MRKWRSGLCDRSREHVELSLDALQRKSRRSTGLERFFISRGMNDQVDLLVQAGESSSCVRSKAL